MMVVLKDVIITVDIPMNAYECIPTSIIATNPSIQHRLHQVMKSYFKQTKVPQNVWDK